MNRLILPLFVAGLTLIPLVLGPTWAATFVSRPLPETTQKTPTLVRGKIGSHTADWVKTSNGGKRIYTFYELQVSEVFKGDPKAGTTIQIREIGGEKDGIGLEVSGSARFTTGEDVVLTLGGKNEDGSYDVLGLMSGKFGIGRDSSGNEILIGATGEDIEGAPAEDHHGPWTLDEFRKMVASQSRNSHSESPTQKTAPSATSATPAPSISAVPAVVASSSPAPQLHSDRDLGAAQSSGTEAYWGYAVTALFLLGGLTLGWKTRKKD
jgi:hypothetical protein